MLDCLGCMPRDSLCIFKLPSTAAGKYIDKFAFKNFLKCGNAAFEISQGFADKEMKELKEMKDKSINSSSAFQGVYAREHHVHVGKRKSNPLSAPSPPPFFPFLTRETWESFVSSGSVIVY